MPTPTSPSSNQHAIEAMDRALESPKGIRVTFSTPGQAIQFRMSCYAARLAARKTNIKIYPFGDPLYGRSPYDSLKLTIINKTIVEIAHPTLDGLEIEEIQ